MVVVDNTGDGGDDEEGVAEKRDTDGDTDGLETTPPGVGDVSAEQGNHVDPLAPDQFCDGESRERKTYQKLLKVPIPVDARWPRPSAPGCFTDAPVLEPGGSGC